MSVIKIITTEDGSHSLYHEGLKETYHSFHGALQESIYVFIEKGLRFWRNKSGLPKEVSIFEVGFGTGLNALLAAQFAMENMVKINYTTLEPFPLAIDLVEKLNYSEQIGLAHLTEIFKMLHQGEWNEVIVLEDFFHFTKLQTKLEDFVTTEKFDVVFFDAFAPNKQAELWEIDMLQKCYDLLNEGGVFTTYSAKGQLKRDLKTVGFEVETLPGPPGKKEMVRGGRN